MQEDKGAVEYKGKDGEEPLILQADYLERLRIDWHIACYYQRRVEGLHWCARHNSAAGEVLTGNTESSSDLEKVMMQQPWALWIERISSTIHKHWRPHIRMRPARDRATLLMQRTISIYTTFALLRPRETIVGAGWTP